MIAGDASLGQRLVTGDAVNTAARLEQAAGAGEIVLGALTYRLARDQIEVEADPAADPQGQGRAGRRVPARRGRAARTPSGPSVDDPVRRPGGGDGRGSRSTLLEVGATRSCELLTVIGEAGVGKSRLIREFAIRASAQGAQPGPARPLPAVRRRRHVLADRRDRPQRGAASTTRIRSRWRSARSPEIARGVGRRHRRPDRRSPTGSPRRSACPPTQFPGPELFWGIRKLLEAIASRRPLVAIVDDIHVAAPTFLELLDHLLDAVHGAPILLLTSARHELFETRAEWAEGHEASRSCSSRSRPTRPTRSSTSCSAGLDASVRERILAAAEGNPLYVEQITSMLDRDRRASAARATAGWRRRRPSELAIPPTVEALVAARLDALGTEERRRDRPGLGDRPRLRRRGGRPPRPGGAPAGRSRCGSRSLTAKQFVRPTVAEADFYRFGHAVIKDAAYRSLLKRDPRRAPRTVRRLGRADQPRAWPRARVRGDPRLPPRAGVPLSDRARAAR